MLTVDFHARQSVSILDGIEAANILGELSRDHRFGSPDSQSK